MLYTLDEQFLYLIILFMIAVMSFQQNLEELITNLINLFFSEIKSKKF